MEKAVIKSKDPEKTIKWYHAKTSNVVALVIIIGFFMFCASLMVWQIPEANQQLMSYLVGQWGIMVGGAIYYLFQYKKEDNKQ